MNNNHEPDQHQEIVGSLAFVLMLAIMVYLALAM